MLHAATGLTSINTDDLRKALASVHRGELVCPPTIENFARVGLQHCANDFLEMLRTVDTAGVRAVLVSVIAERRVAEKRAQDDVQRDDE